MGTWGAQILQDDFANDVRDEYLDHLFAGLTSIAATDAMAASYGELDVDEHPVFWLSLAATQTEYGRLTDRARKEALRVIDEGLDLLRWKGDPKRAKVLAKLRSALTGAQPKEKKLVNRKAKLTVGDFFRLPFRDRGFAFGRVLHGTMRAFYLFVSTEKDVALAELQAKEIAFIVGSTDDGFSKRRWKVIGNLPLEARLTQPIFQFHQSVGSATCTVFDVSDEWRGSTRENVPEEECIGMEQWGSASEVHVVERLTAALEGGLSDFSLVKTRVTGGNYEDGPRPARMPVR